jgi:hypothetical protein
MGKKKPGKIKRADGKKPKGDWLRGWTRVIKDGFQKKRREEEQWRKKFPPTVEITNPESTEGVVLGIWARDGECWFAYKSLGAKWTPEMLIQVPKELLEYVGAQRGC